MRTWSVTRSAMNETKQKQFEVILAFHGCGRSEIEFDICAAIGTVKNITELSASEADMVLEYRKQMRQHEGSKQHETIAS